MPVYRFALALTNDLAEADDVAQEAFVRLWRTRATIDWTESAVGWLLVAARRVAQDRFRRLARELRLRPTPSVPIPIVRAPASLENCTAKCPTPPAAPEISEVCPRSRPARSCSACHAVMPATGIAAACSWLMPAGFLAIILAGEVANSA